MQIKYSYWYFQKALSLKFCEQVIQCGKKSHKVQASIGKKKKMSKKDLENTRDYKISFFYIRNIVSNINSSLFNTTRF